MTKFPFRLRPFAASLLLCAVFQTGAALAQSDGTPSGPLGASGAQGDSWDSIKALPDIYGPWRSNDLIGRPQDMASMPLTAKGKAIVEQNAKTRAGGGDVEGRAKYCITLGFPGGMSGPEEITEILYVPGRVIMTDVEGNTRMIFTDGRKHHSGPPTMMGDSIGHWENGTLVIDTVGLQRGNEIAYGFPIGNDVHVVERLTPKDRNTMVIVSTFEAPDIFTAPYVHTATYQRHDDWAMTEWDCAQNNRDLTGEGAQQMNLTLPEEHPTTLPSTPRRTKGSRRDGN